MKRIRFFLILAAAVFALYGFASAVPQFINFQGSLSDNAGDPVNDPNLQMVFSIYGTASEGTALWTETQNVKVIQGKYNVLLGSVTPFPVDLFANETLYLGIAVGSDPEMTPRSQIGSTPSALHAMKADSAGHAAKADSAGNAHKADSSGHSQKADSSKHSARADSSKHAARSDSSGHADRAKRADTADVALTVVPNSILLEDLGQNGASNGQIIKWDGGAWSLASDEVGSGAFLPLAGGTMTGAIANTGDPDITMGKGNFGTGNLNPGTQAFVAGSNNRARGAYSIVSGGGGATSADSNSANADYSTVGGGTRNKATQNYATVGGGSGNRASQIYATVSGGLNNIASNTYSTVGGGLGNTASQTHATVGGGSTNTASYNDATVGGGTNNTASQSGTTVAGGMYNVASGGVSMIPGGANNRASGQVTFAAGFKAEAAHDGAFVWADHTGFPVGSYFLSERADQFRVRANGGVRLDVNGSRWVNMYDDGTNLINTSVGATLTIGGAWTNASDRNLKENFTPVDGKLLLEKLSRLPITMWNYKTESRDVKHIGPMAQDFYAAFNVGDNDRTISTIDPAGIALAAIQELNRKVSEIDQLRAELRELKKVVETLRAERQPNGKSKTASTDEGEAK